MLATSDVLSQTRQLETVGFSVSTVLAKIRH